MQMSRLVLILVTCELCAGIRVPASWDYSDSEVKQEQFAANTFNPVNSPSQPIPIEYFEYKAKKPQFALDVASFHGVQSPENHYSAYPVKPHTSSLRPELGKHKIITSENTLHKSLQEFANINENHDHTEIDPSYEVFHPYEAEVPALQELYKDPILNKIRGDLENSKNRLQKYENEAGNPDIKKDEYLESPHKTGNRLVPHRNVPVPFEIHRPQRKPVYYHHGPRYNPRDQYLNHRLRHPWNQYVKVRPAHYQPLKNHIHHLRQSHALKYDDERNEYPQVHILENLSSDPKDGYDIYEKGKDKYVQLLNNVDESINKAVKENRPTTYQKLEIQNNHSSDTEEEDEDEFVPIKNYAQVRKTETYKHLPRSAALREAESLDEIRNAPRLREAVKSTKAQTVYSEEGYEDAAYDHAGEQKHAEENEGHGGFLKQNELSGGKYKIPSESGSFDDHHGSLYRDKIIDGKKWKVENKDQEQELDEEDYSEDEHEHLLEAANHQEQDVPDENNSRNKRENQNKVTKVVQDNITEEVPQHELDKRETKFVVPQIDFNSTFLSEEEILKIAKIKATPKQDDLKSKYPYYFKNIRSLSKDSPLRYAENLKLIPKKSKGGTEFYDSRASFECPEIDDVPDPVPDKLKRGDNPDTNDEESPSKGEENFETTKKQPRLKGLGDKIDCFKAKYFGENPLDSPFFKEDIIRNPEPVTIPNTAVYKLVNSPFIDSQRELNASESKISIEFDKPLQFKSENLTDLFDLIDKLRNDNKTFNNGFLSNVKMFSSALKTPNNQTQELQQTNIYSDIIKNIKEKTRVPMIIDKSNNIPTPFSTQTPSQDKNITYSSFHNIEDITKPSMTVRKKRAAPFTYEPYKIIRDTPVQDSKKTTTTNNISPLIKQLQSSRVVERVSKSTPESILSDVSAKGNVNSRVYKDIGRNDRKQTDELSKNDKPAETAIIDVNIDKRRGEPRYEIRHSNHKSTYTPVGNKKAMTLEDYKSQTNSNAEDKPTQKPPRKINPTRKPYFDVSKCLPQIADVQNTAASNTVRKTVQSTTETTKLYKDEINSRPDNDGEEDYDEYEDYEVDDVTTTTTTIKPAFRRRTTVTSTTEAITEPPRLRLVTRFRDYNPETKIQNKAPVTEKTVMRFQAHREEVAPQYREKKKKLTKSTLVTDTKKYGDEHDNDMRKEEVDAMIGVKQDIEDYMPLYEKEKLNKKTNKNNEDDKDKDNRDKHDENDDEETSQDDDDDDYSDEEEDDDDEDRINEDDDEEEDEDSEEEDTTEYQNKKTNDLSLTVTTPEPTKRTLSITTDAPIPTSPVRLAQLREKPVITRKKIEIHKELPVNKSLPHVTQYKQDIREVEIIKEIPRKRKPIKNAESLELYKDDKLAEEINKLGDVEVFRENLDLKTGPKHGGNYRSLSTTIATPTLKQKPKGDTEASQTKYTKEIRQDSPQKNRINFKAHGNGEKSEKVIELVEPTKVAMHGGNLRHKGRVKPDHKSEKLIELDEDNINDYSSSNDSLEDSPYISRRERPRHGLHGGNYRSANLMVEPQEISEATQKVNAKEARRKGAVLLNSFAQAVPVLTTTPSFILDPSKRMYYYVDA